MDFYMSKEVAIENELIHSFLLISRMMNIEIRYDDLIHKIGLDEILEEDLVYVATEYYGMKSKIVKVDREKISKNPLPALVKLKDNRYTILFSIKDRKSVV